MSFKTISNSNNAGKIQKKSNAWIRNPSWQALPPVGPTEQKFIGLMAIYPEANFQALSVSVSSGNAIVDWGDGTTDIASGTLYHQYDYNDSDFANTNAPVTLTDSGDLVTRTAHGYNNGMTVKFYNIVSTTGITEGQTYYVVNATANTFQISATQGGTAVALTTDGSATLLPYKQAIVTITPQTANITQINLNIKHNQSGLQKYDTQWLDIELGSPNMTSLTISSTSTNVNMNMLERVAIRNIGSATSFAGLCNGMSKLGSFVCTADTSAVTATNSMFTNCYSLQSVPLFNTANVTTMASMFQACSSLQWVPLFNTASVSTMQSMFSNCTSLPTVPLLNTANVTTMASMFSNCNTLSYVPKFNTSLVASMGSMFLNCANLQTVPQLDTSAVTNASNMFGGCIALISVPPFNFASCTNFSSMFSGCTSLPTVPLFNMPVAQNISGMFTSCTGLNYVPTIASGAPINNATAMFQSCANLVTIPALDLQNVTTAGNLGSFVTSCLQASSFLAYNMKIDFSITGMKLSQTAIETVFSNLNPGQTTAAVTVSSSNWGGPAVISKTNCGTTSGSTTVTQSNTTSLAVGMEVVGTGITDPVAVTFTDAGDLVTRTAHGLTNGTMVSFPSIVTTTGLTAYTPYYVVNATANTFQVSNTVGGSARALTTDGSGTVTYPVTITAITPSTNFTISVPASATGTVTTTSALLRRSLARLRGWAVT